jgi:hypothetical protein
MAANEHTITFQGMREFTRALNAMGDDLGELKATHAEAAEVVAMRAAVIAPRRSGFLADSLRSSGTRAGGKVRAGSASLVPYAGPIHFGWPARNIRPQPFIYDAIDDRRSQVLDVYAERVDAIARAKGLK